MKMGLGSFFRGASGHKRFYKRQTNVKRLQRFRPQQVTYKP